ncbi:glycosyltransferase [Shinella sp. AETb1-6]|nr:glycosyltransferase [Shinella sp. AETb1-6]
MKIAYVCSGPVPSLAANSVHVMKMCAAMAENEHQVTLLSPTYQADRAKVRVRDVFRHYGVKRSFRHVTIPSIRLPRVAVRSHRFFLRSILRLMRPDLVYTRVPEAALLAADLGLRVILERHDTFSEESKRYATIFEAVARHRNCVAIVVISHALKTELSKQFSLPGSCFIVAADAADRVDDVKPLLFESNRPRAGYAGHLYSGKGIEVIDKLARSMPDVDFHILGGTADDIAAQSARMSGLSNVVFHGHLPPVMVPEYIKAFDVLLAPYQEKVSVSGGRGDVSRWMSPLKIFEYMASRRPMVASDLPVLREVLNHEVNCLLVPPADYDAWEAQVRRVLDDAVLAEGIAEQAYCEFLERYTWKARAENILRAVTQAEKSLEVQAA